MPAKQKTGVVVSDKMDKSIVVEVTRNKMHSLYKKVIRVRKRFMAHDESNTAHIGDYVRIEESRPLSKRKSWTLAEIIRVAPGQGLAVKHTATAVASEKEAELNLSAPMETTETGGTGVSPVAAADTGDDARATIESAAETEEQAQP